MKFGRDRQSSHPTNVIPTLRSWNARCLKDHRSLTKATTQRSAAVKLELLEEIAYRARDVHAARCAALTVLHSLYDSCRLRALRTIGALICVHNLLTVTGLGNLRHGLMSPGLLCRTPFRRCVRSEVGWDGSHLAGGSAFFPHSLTANLQERVYTMRLGFSGQGCEGPADGLVESFGFGICTRPLPPAAGAGTASPGIRRLGAGGAPSSGPFARSPILISRVGPGT